MLGDRYDRGIGVPQDDKRACVLFKLAAVAVQGCASHALYMSASFSETTFVATRCEFANSAQGAEVEGNLTSATLSINPATLVFIGTG